MQAHDLGLNLCLIQKDQVVEDSSVAVDLSLRRSSTSDQNHIWQSGKKWVVNTFNKMKAFTNFHTVSVKEDSYANYGKTLVGRWETSYSFQSLLGDSLVQY